MPTAAPSRPQILGRLLVEEGALTEPALREALRRQRGTGRRLGDLLIEAGRIDEETLARALALQLGIPFAPAPLEPAPDAAKVVPPAWARERGVLPLDGSGRSLRLAMADPLDIGTVDDVGFQMSRRVEPVVATPSAVQEGWARATGGELQRLVGALPRIDRGDEDPASLERAARAAPVVRLVDHLLAGAAAAGASDIHVEDQGDGVRVRYRVDGVLREVAELPARAHDPVVSRLKIMAGMDIAVKRRPQDGGLALPLDGRELTLRVSTLPVQGGEKAVVRLLDPARAPRDLAGLGLGHDELRRLRAILRGGQGVLLATGPTGSGKSSTLHAALHEVDRRSLNVVTLEDPVEYRIPGVTHLQVDPRAGLTFPAALRSVLRQDPDVIMVGEIRDRETAEIAMTAAVTGHLVLSTLHTIDAPGAVVRLLDMGVPPFLVAGGLAGVLAQRLVRRVCPACRGRGGSAGQGDPAAAPGGGAAPESRPCPRCTDGYRGRTGIFQLLLMTDVLRDEVARSARGEGTSRLRRLAREGGMRSLAEDARRAVAEGVTTPQEIARALRGDPDARSCGSCGAALPAEAEGCPRCGWARHRRCRCGRRAEPGWRFCPWCLRKL